VGITEKRNIFQRVFGNRPLKQDNSQYSTVQMLNGYSNRITSYSGGLYDDDTIRATIDTIARHFSKMQIVHKLKGNKQTGSLAKLLNNRPNELMSTYDFLYKVVTNLYVDNNAYVYIKRDEFGSITGLYPIPYSQAEWVKDKNNNLYLKFTFNGGQTVTESESNIIVLRKHFYKNDLYGESNYTPLYPLVNLLFTIREGIINAVKSSAFIRGILKFTTVLQDEDRKKNQKEFQDNYLTAQNSGGVVVTDGKMEYIPIENKPVMINSTNTAYANEKVFQYFGVCEAVIKGKYTEDEWNAFYESVLEPLAIQFSQEFTYKIFSQREIDFGNSIVFVADRLSYMSTQSKISMITAVKELGVLNKGQLADILNIDAPPDAEEYLQSLNYVNSKIASEYQLGYIKKPKEEGGEEVGKE
jgi:HK97 family phage portal protein